MVNLWLVVVILLLIVELISHNVVTIWYAIGAIFSLVISMYWENYVLELAVFILLGTILTIILRPVLNSYIKEKLDKLVIRKKKN